jgi:hypothetical protein
MRCHENGDGAVHEPSVSRSGALVHFGAWLLLFAWGCTWALRLRCWTSALKAVAADVFANHTRVASRDAQQRECRSLGRPSILLPVSERVNADAERVGKLGLSQPDEASKGSHITGLQLAAHDALALIAAQRPGEVGLGEFTCVLHRCCSVYSA